MILLYCAVVFNLNKGFTVVFNLNKGFHSNLVRFIMTFGILV